MIMENLMGQPESWPTKLKIDGLDRVAAVAMSVLHEPLRPARGATLVVQWPTQPETHYI